MQNRVPVGHLPVGSASGDEVQIRLDTGQAHTMAMTTTTPSPPSPPHPGHRVGRARCRQDEPGRLAPGGPTPPSLTRTPGACRGGASRLDPPLGTWRAGS